MNTLLFADADGDGEGDPEAAMAAAGVSSVMVATSAATSRCLTFREPILIIPDTPAFLLDWSVSMADITQYQQVSVDVSRGRIRYVSEV